MTASPLELHGKYFVVDTFTDKPLSGNPAVVLFAWNNNNNLSIHSQKDTTATLVRIAQDLASVEVAVVLPPPADSTKIDFTLRFFTKNTETPFCGHATIAAAHICMTELGGTSYKSSSSGSNNNNAGEIHFFVASTKSIVVVRKVDNGTKLEISLKPTLPSRLLNQDQLLSLSQRLAKCLSLSSPDRIRAIFPHTSSQNLIVVLHSVEDVIGAKTNRNDVLDLLQSVETHQQDVMKANNSFAKLMITAAMPQHLQVKNQNQNQSTSSSSMTTFQERGYDFVSRLFAPKIGIDEDACSAASTAILARLWQEFFGESFASSNKKRLFAFQASPRGGEMVVTVRGSRVGVAGAAVTVASGTLRFDFFASRQHQSKL